MSRATSAVVMLGRRSGCAAAHASAYISERFSQVDSRASVFGTYGGRSPWKYFGMHESAGRLEPTPRGSKPIQSYTDALNLTAEQAVDQNVAETIQPSVDAFVAWLDGRPGRNGPIATAGAPIETETLPWYLAVLRVLTDPNLVFLLLLVGLAGVGFEIFHPGAIVPAVVGAISLLLALAGLTVLPFQWTGVALLVLGVALFIAETQVAGFGVLAIGGIVALALGGAFLFDSDDPALEPSTGVVVATAAVVGGAFAVAAHLVLRARRQPSSTGGAELVGEVGRARGTIGPGGGSVLVNGEIWSARPLAGVEIPAGGEVRVVTVHRDDLTLTVEPRER